MGVEQSLKGEELRQNIRDYISATLDDGFLAVLEILNDKTYIVSEHVQAKFGNKGLVDFWGKVTKKHATISHKIMGCFGTGHLR